MNLQRSFVALGKAASELRIDIERVHVERDAMLAAFEGGDTKAKREYIKRVISRVEYDPDADTITVHVSPGTLSIISISPVAAKIVRSSAGARDQT